MTLKEISPLDIKLVKNTSYEPLLNILIEHHHYLGYLPSCGRATQIHGICRQKTGSCFSWSSAARHIGARDRYIGWKKQHQDHNLCCIAYNSRFLILPWFRVPHLASWLLGYMSRNWQNIYCHPVYYLETFVDTELFAGTCYKAANWDYLDDTT